MVKLQLTGKPHACMMERLPLLISKVKTQELASITTTRMCANCKWCTIYLFNLHFFYTNTYFTFFIHNLKTRHDHFNLSRDFSDNDDVKFEGMILKNSLYVSVRIIGKIASLVNLHSGHVNRVFIVLSSKVGVDHCGNWFYLKLMAIWNLGHLNIVILILQIFIDFLFSVSVIKYLHDGIKIVLIHAFSKITSKLNEFSLNSKIFTTYSILTS